jgi:hypothetical protein
VRTAFYNFCEGLRDHRSVNRLPSVLACFAVALAMAWPEALQAQSLPPARPAAEQGRAQKQSRAPYLRIERVQACLKDLKLYNGPISGSASTATSRAVHRLVERRDLVLFRTLVAPEKTAEELTRRSVQTLLREACRDSLARIDRERATDPEDRCGTAARYSTSRKACVCIDGHARYDGICLPRVAEANRTVQSAAPVPAPRPIAPTSQPVHTAAPPAVPSPVRSAAASTAVSPLATDPATATPPTASFVAEISPVTCLPSDLKAMLPKRGVQRNALPVCELPCLSPPVGIKANDLRQYEQASGVSWCSACIPFSAYLPLEDVERIERAGNLTLCRQAPRTAVNVEAESRPDGIRIFKGPRALFSRRQAAVPHGNVAVVVTLQRYRSGLMGSAHAARDGTAMRALLAERLGFQNDNIVELKEAALSDLVRLFGSATSPKGELWERLNAPAVAPGASLLVYISGLGAFRAADPGAFLLPVDAERGREEASGYPLARMIDNLARLGASSTTVLLEVDFSRGTGQMVLTPNVPEAADPLLPAGPPTGNRAAIAVLTAADRDQRTLEDPEYGIGLFTRHLITGLSGAADLAPIGNGDNAVDPLELYIHAAHRVGLAARRSFGVTQKPSLFRPHGLPIARLNEIVN